jgi:methylated-DNA-[protein]-cysteine S-methyltransferase
MEISPFARRCYQLVAQIPKGRVTTYKALAEAMGTRGYQAIGRALNANPHLVTIPCHRIVHQDGRLGGYAAGVEQKRQLLESEGVEIVDDRVNLKQYFWRPGKRS